MSGALILVFRFLTIFSNEIVAGLIIALPWITLSWFYEHYAQWTRPEPTSTSSVGNLDRVISRTFGLTAATLIVYGGWALARLNLRGEGEHALKKLKLDPSTGTEALSQICSIALPIYATLQVGGFLVAFALAVAVGSGLPTVFRDHAAPSDDKGRRSFKKLTAALVPTVVVLSFFGMNSLWNRTPFFGYIALLASAFIIRPPFPSAPSPAPEKGNGLGISIPGHLNGSAQSLSHPAQSSLDPAMATLSGLVLGCLTLLSTRTFSFGASDIVYLSAVAGTMATCITYLDLTHVYSPSKIGVAIATGGAALLCSPPAQDDIYIVYIIRALLATTSFFAARFDDKRSRSNDHTHHHHSASESSSATKLILRYSEPYPLLYSILKERDSRRIFYFMTYIHPTLDTYFPL